jgi:DNA/RNA endonuclease YhcR with UshA esterase domain
MKAFILALLLTLTAAPALAETITAAEAKNHIGQNVTVEAVVSEVHHVQSGRATLIDMGGSYPNNAFTAVIFKDDFSKFSTVDSLAGKTIDVTGQVKEYQGRPEIILNDPAQLKVK